MDNVENKTAFITGGASGIGLGIAKVLARAGANVAIADLRTDHLHTALDWFADNELGERVFGFEVDVSDRTSFTAAADAAEAKFGKIHILICNAGVDAGGPLKQASFDDWDFGIGVNLYGVVNGLQIFLPRLLAHGEGGHIVNTASLAGLVPMPGIYAIYAATKAAVIALSESVREGLAEDGIGVSVLCPGPVKSNIHQSGRNRPERFRDGSGFADAETRLEQRPVSELWMEPETVGEMVLKAILDDTLYVITHGEWRDAFKMRVDAILEAMPTDVNPELIASLGPPEV